MRRARERRNKVDVGCTVDLARQRLDLRGLPNDLELVAEPLHGGTGHRDRALEGVDRRGVPELITDGAEAVARATQLLAGVEQQEVAVP